MISAADYQPSAARAAHAHLRRLHDGLRVQVIHAWLVENRSHPKARAVDALLSDFLFTGNPTDLEDAETITDRHPGSAS
jgi:hypothetical protein